MMLTLPASRSAVRVHLVACVVLATAAVTAQTPAFDAVSITVNNSGDQNSRFGGLPGRLMATNNTLRNIIRNVWGVSDAQIVGGPDWIRRDRFDLIATSSANPNRDQMLAMAKNMLADRFKLRARLETREVPVYALVLARPDGRLGPQIRPSTLVCDRPLPTGPDAAPPKPPAPLAGVDVPTCGTNLNAGALRSGGITLDAFARRLTDGVDRIVVNQTGLSGAFDIVMQAGSAGAATTENVAAMFTAIQEQLGLKLEARTAPAEVLVIEHVEHPTAN